MKRRVRALIIKEFYQIIRDPSTFLISLVFPALLLFIYGFGVSLDMDHLPIGLIMEDTSPDAQSFAKALTDSRYFTVTMGTERKPFNEQVVTGTLKGFVVIPSYFSSFRARPPNRAPIQVIADGSDPNTATFIQNYTEAAFQNWLQQEAISRDLQGLPLVQLQPRFWYNEELESRNFLIPGSLAIIMTLIGTLLTALVIAREWERGTMEAIMATPVTIVELIIAKLVPYFVLGLCSMAVSVLFALICYQIPFRGSLAALALCSSVFLFAALGLGLLISTLSKNQFVASQISLITAFLPAFMLSGFIFEISSMPLPIRILTYAMPARYFVSCLQTLFLAGNVWGLIFKNAFIMLLIGFIFFLITAKKTVKRLD